MRFRQASMLRALTHKIHADKNAGSGLMDYITDADRECWASQDQPNLRGLAGVFGRLELMMSKGVFSLAST